MATRVRADTSKRLGALLLKGWAMLAENCPDCQVPLMKERTSQERLCVNCDTTFVPDGQGLRPVAEWEAAAPPQPDGPPSPHRPESPVFTSREAAAPGVGAGGDESGQDDEDVPYNSLADPRLGPFAALPGGASPAGLPGSGAGGTSRGGSGGAAASSHDVEIGQVGGFVATPSQPTTVPCMGAPLPAEAAAGGTGRGSVAAAQASPPPASTAATISASAVDDVADRLSTKMLQGWALLDKYCPRCSTVLVRSKTTRRMFCVACDAWVVSEGEAAAAAAKPATHTSQLPQASAVSGGAPPPPPTQPKSSQPVAPAANGSGPPHPHTTPHAQAKPEGPQGLHPGSLAAAPDPPALASTPSSPLQTPQQQQQQHPQPHRHQLHPLEVPHADAASATVPLASPGNAAGLSPLSSAAPRAGSFDAHWPPAAVPPPPGPMAAATAARVLSPPLAAPTPGSSQLPPFLVDPALLQHHQHPHQHQLPPGYLQFFQSSGTPTGLSRGSSPPSHWYPSQPAGYDALLALGSGKAAPASASTAAQQAPSPAAPGPTVPPHQAGATRSSRHPSNSGSGLTGGSGSGSVYGLGSGAGGSKQPGASQLLLTIGRTVALKMSEAQGLLERTPALDTERARSYVSLISECLDLLAKLHTLQQ